MSESNDAATASSGSKPAASGGKLVMVLALVNFLAVLGLGGYIVYTRQLAAAQSGKGAADGHGDKKEGGHDAAKAEAHGDAKAEHGEEQAAEHAAPDEEHGEAKEGHGGAAEEEVASPHGDERSGGGPLLALESMVTNMAEPDSDRYLKVAMQLRLTSEAAKPEVEAQLVPVRNQILLYLSSLTIANTTGADNKREIQKRVKRIANESMPSSRITQVYFTEFVIQ